MKKFLGTILLGLSSILSADIVDPVLEMPSLNITSDFQAPPFEEKPFAKPAFFYVRFAAAENNITRPDTPLPGLGIGYRRLAGDGAADISISGIGYAEKNNDHLFWTAPKASYIHYLQPSQKESFYVGGGLAWGGLRARGQNFIGIIPSATGGYEFVRKSTVLGFTELNLSQPALAVSKKGTFPGPILEWTVGIGF